MAKTKLEEMTLAELDAELHKLRQQRDELKVQMRQLVAVRDVKAGQESAAQKLAVMPEAEREAMRQLISAEAVHGADVD